MIKKRKLGKIDRKKITQHRTTTIRVSYGDGAFDMGTILLDEDGYVIKTEYYNSIGAIQSSCFDASDKIDEGDEYDFIIEQFEMRMANKAKEAEKLLESLERL